MKKRFRWFAIFSICSLILSPIGTPAKADHQPVPAILDLSPVFEDLPVSAQHEEITDSDSKSVPFSLQVKELSDAITKFPDNATLLEKRAIVYGNHADYDWALADIKKGLELHGERYSYYWTKAQIEMRQKNYTAALQDCFFARKIAPGQVRWISDWLRSEALREMGDSRESIKAAKRALNSMANYGVAFDPHTDNLKALLNGSHFEPERQTLQNARVLRQVAKLSSLVELPDDEQLAKILNLRTTQLQHPFKDPNKALCIVTDNLSPWLSLTEDSEHPLKQIELRLDSDVCNISAEDLKNSLKAKPSDSGRPAEFVRENEHCAVSFYMNARGSHALNAVRVGWR